MNAINVNLNMLGASGFNWYGFLIGAGMILSIVLAYFIAKKRGYYKDVVFDMALCTIPLAIVGARAYYIIFDLIEHPDAAWTFKRIIGLEGGLSGLAIYGGLIGACLGAIIVLFIRKKKPDYDRITFMQMADLAFPLILMSQAIGRWGNFINQEAYGNPVTNGNLQWFPYAVYIDAAEGWFQATFFYESMWNIVGAALLLWMYLGKRKSFDGFVFSSYCIWYGAGRLVIEGLRSDSLWLVPGVIRISQLVSGLIIVFGIVYIVVHAYKARTKQLRPFILVDQNKLGEEYYGYDKSILYLASLRPEVEEKPEKPEPEFEEVDDEDRYWEVDSEPDSEPDPDEETVESTKNNSDEENDNE